MDHELLAKTWGQRLNPLNPFAVDERRCEVCKMLESDMTTDCLGRPPERAWVNALADDICDYVGDQWVDWSGKPVSNDVLVLRERYNRYTKRKEEEGRRRPELEKKMRMEDKLLQDDRYRGCNPSPFDR